MRAWRFSSVRSGSRPANGSASAASNACHHRLDRQLEQLAADVLREPCASPRVPSEEYGEGIVTHVRQSAPTASAAMSATSVESMPPLRPSTTCSKPFLRA